MQTHRPSMFDFEVRWPWRRTESARTTRLDGSPIRSSAVKPADPKRRQASAFHTPNLPGQNPAPRSKFLRRPIAKFRSAV